MGLEPTRPYEHRHLKPACLPIPARSHIILLRTLEYYTIGFPFVKREKRDFRPLYLPRFIQIRAPRRQQGKLAADGGDEGHVQLGNEGGFLLVALVEDIAPGGADDGVPPRMVGGRHIPRRGTADGEALFIHRPLTEEKLPMGRACGHIEGGGDDDHLRAAEGHQAA